ncbi:MAG TPA: hypothetical protein VMR41_05620 [Patescibacteria group bacterium]|nr:hypothetical protein [Patescibacteria group bacterium]
MKNSMIITIVVVVIVAAAAFFGGMKYQQMQAGSTSRFAGQYGQGGTGGQGRFGGGQGGAGLTRNGGGATVGDIVAQDSDSITLKLSDGSSKIVNLSSSTTINKMTTGSTSDLKTGERVAAIGTTNSDGSITAQTIQLNPTFRGGPTGGQPGSQNSSAPAQ